jgi:SAM-dependent methyltransferase
MAKGRGSMTVVTKGHAMEESFRNLLYNNEVFELFKAVTIQSYLEHSNGYEKPMEELLNTTFRLLEQSKGSDEELSIAVLYIVNHVFNKKDPSFWFNQIYKHYKRYIKPQDRYSRILPYLEGGKIVDVGCGDALLSSLLKRKGFEVYATDVLDYRDEQAQDIPFLNMRNTVDRLPFSNWFADTSILFSVLHHIHDEHLPNMIRELKRVSRRIVIEENCYGLSLSDASITSGISTSKVGFLKQYLSLSSENQRSFLKLSDYFSNAIGQGLLEMNFPFGFKTINEWKEIFRSNGMNLRVVQLLGFQKTYFTRSCDVLFVVDSEDFTYE